MFCVTHKGLDSMKKDLEKNDYAFQRQFNEKPSIITGCPGTGLKAFMPQWSLRCKCRPEASIRAHSIFEWQQLAKGTAHARNAGELADIVSVHKRLYSPMKLT